VWPESFKSRLLALHPERFRERVLPGCLRCACLMESSSRHPARRTSSPVPPTGSVSRDMSDRTGQVRFFKRMCQVANTGAPEWMNTGESEIGVHRVQLDYKKQTTEVPASQLFLPYIKGWPQSNRQHLHIVCAGSFAYPFLHKRRAGGKQS
jgi:hypothetical protein